MKHEAACCYQCHELVEECAWLFVFHEHYGSEHNESEEAMQTWIDQQTKDLN